LNRLSKIGQPTLSGNSTFYRHCRFEGEIYGKLTGVLLNYVRRHQDEEISILLKLPKALSRRSGK